MSLPAWVFADNYLYRASIITWSTRTQAPYGKVFISMGG